MESRTEIKINHPEVRLVEDKIKDRFSETKTDRMVEYITGLSLDSSELLDRMEEDQVRVREKYGLPSRDYKFDNPAEYERYLRGLAEFNGIEIRSKSDCGKFFEKNTMAGAAYFGNSKSIGVGIEKNDMKKYFEGITSLEHETIHSLQSKFYPEMPIEVMEYEAYVANWNIDYLRSNKDTVGVVFSFGVGGSVGYWYKEQSEVLGEVVQPIWDSPEYFLLNIDGVNQEQIDEYKTRQIDKSGEDIVINQALDNVRV